MMDPLVVTEQIPEIQWQHGDDLCDCTFQRIGWWTNPYLGKTMEFRLCCAWVKLINLHPELAECCREIPAFDNYNLGVYETEPREWDGEADMPRGLWYRQLAAQTGKPLEQIRQDYDHLMPPKGVKKPETLQQDAFLLQYLQSEADREGLEVTITEVS